MAKRSGFEELDHKFIILKQILACNESVNVGKKLFNNSVHQLSHLIPNEVKDKDFREIISRADELKKSRARLATKKTGKLKDETKDKLENDYYDTLFAEIINLLQRNGMWIEEHFEDTI